MPAGGEVEVPVKAVNLTPLMAAMACRCCVLWRGRMSGQRPT